MKYKVTFEGKTKTYAALKHIAWHLQDCAENKHEGSLLNLQAASVFYAFTFEAYLNHVGAEEIAFWNEIEKISYSAKLRVIAKQLKLKIEYGKAPFQQIGELFQLRNALAHGRTQTINHTYETDTEPGFDAVWRVHSWEQLTSEKVAGYAKAIKEAVETLNKARPKPDRHVWNQGVRGRNVQPL